MVAIDRNRALRSNSPIAGRGGNRTRRKVASTSIINIKVTIIEVMIGNRRRRGRASIRLIIISIYHPPQDSFALTVLIPLSFKVLVKERGELFVKGLSPLYLLLRLKRGKCYIS